MFESIKNSWNKSEAEMLRKEFVDMIECTRERGVVNDPLLAKTISTLITNLYKEHEQDIFTLDVKNKKILAKMLISKARDIGGDNFVPAAGLSFVAFAVKASYLPGEDAAFVKKHCDEFIKSAFDDQVTN